MAKGFNQSFRFVPKIVRDEGEGDSSRQVIVEDRPSYSQEAACVVLGASMAEVRRLKRDGHIRSAIPADDFSESELTAIHAEVRARGRSDRMKSELPQYVSKTRFYSLLGCCFVTGERYLSRGVLHPAAILDGDTPIFEHSGKAIQESHRAISEYRQNLRLSKYNLTLTKTS
ncbi:MAG: hypothetical protein WB696_31720 [Chthoniobacterales bacterium]